MKERVPFNFSMLSNVMSNPYHMMMNMVGMKLNGMGKYMFYLSGMLTYPNHVMIMLIVVLRCRVRRLRTWPCCADTAPMR